MLWKIVPIVYTQMLILYVLFNNLYKKRDALSVDRVLSPFNTHFLAYIGVL